MFWKPNAIRAVETVFIVKNYKDMKIIRVFRTWKSADEFCGDRLGWIVSEHDVE